MCSFSSSLCSCQFVVNWTNCQYLISEVTKLFFIPSARSVVGPSSRRLPQLQLYAHSAARLSKPPLLPTWLHPGIHADHVYSKTTSISGHLINR